MTIHHACNKIQTSQIGRENEMEIIQRETYSHKRAELKWTGEMNNRSIKCSNDILNAMLMVRKYAGNNMMKQPFNGLHLSFIRCVQIYTRHTNIAHEI